MTQLGLRRGGGGDLVVGVGSLPLFLSLQGFILCFMVG